MILSNKMYIYSIVSISDTLAFSYLRSLEKSQPMNIRYFLTLQLTRTTNDGNEQPITNFAELAQHN